MKPWLPADDHKIALDGDILYSESIDNILNQLETDSAQGLTAAEPSSVCARSDQQPDRREERILLQKLLNQFKDFMIIILIIASVISGILGEIADAIIIIAIVIINAVLGLIQEGRAEKAIEALQKMSAPHARIVRDGQQMSIEAEELVPEILCCWKPMILAADIRLIESSNLKAEEAALTGESVPVEKMPL